MTLRIIDTETCGLDGGIVEVASIDLIDGQLANPMSDLVCPDRPISIDAMAIHHITEAMVEDKPRIAVAISRYLGSDYYVAHNAAFDRGVLPEMRGRWICTLKLARMLYPDIKYGNQYLRYALNLDVQLPQDNTLYPHRALYDCYVTAALLQRIIKDSSWSAEEMADITERPSLIKTFKFGKYRGRLIEQIAQEDPGYLQWMLKNLTDLNPDMKHTLKYYLIG
ncbi:exodeoxyribonuclease X [Serratia rhizosphaerae]|uniref:exodeoxyribonuclease X n=1 Tax=unclassified Serratia (in: enterobacteria) TaxID=2647522 RepID=UPI000CF6E49F|nr:MULTISPECIES: exodeoxyribonuclease X [unclassified Serratia (in: enterobacteria)]MBU3894241.1 exodeoxyribonuclease X [Serratia rubidaea]AVJ18077.1 exodeoxyribonuclease X [Serratia sp. MYb239]MCA4822921.1 exodeoxyribonuclease X [Serratia rubidaea]QNK34388.1 exodeoxyribonuclease X [Serratia sp. JUb9]QPT11715.1 exodeoxyribonuclease X [Serratia rubidaea]